MITTLQTFEHGRIDYDDTVPCMVVVQIGFMDSHEFRSWLNDGLKLLREKKKMHNEILWMADVREADIVAPQDTEWAATDWSSRAMQEGVTHIAFVRPKDIMAEMSITNYEEIVQELTVESKKIILANFHDIEEAKEWLRKIKIAV